MTTYIAGNSPVHKLDARVKVVLLPVYSVVLFLVDTWVGMACAAVLFLLALAVSRVPAGRVFKLAVPVYVLVAFAVFFNAFVFATPELFEQADAATAAGNVFAGIYPLLGSFSLTIPGLLRGLFYAVRIVLLVYASFMVTFTTTSTQLVDAFNSFMKPLRHLGVPTDDVAMVLSIALRFIPVTAEEFCRVRDAQWSRGAAFGEGGPTQRLRAWTTVLVPLFVGLFRRADALAQAMDARCYGMPGVQRTSLACRTLRASDIAALAIGCMALVALAVLW